MRGSALLFVEPPLSEAELLALSDDSARRVVAEFAAERRRRESLMWRYIIRRELGDDVRIGYNENGSPQLLNRREYVGVSHSADFVAVILSHERCAVDVERLDRNFERVAARYIRPEEWTLSRDERLAAVLWSAKETLYKYSDERGLDFLRDIKILEVDFGQATVVGQIKDTPPVKMQLKFYSDNVVVYVG